MGEREMELGDFIAGPNDLLLITGAAGFIGSRVVENLLERGFTNIRCFARPSCDVVRLRRLLGQGGSGRHVEVFKGNLLSLADCLAAVEGATVIFHLAAGRGEKSFPDAFLNSVVTTRNLLEASVQNGHLKRFVNVSSFSVYDNRHRGRRGVLDETCPVEAHPEAREDAYCFAKTKQDEIVAEYGSQRRLPYVTVRPGHVYGSGNEPISGRVGIDTFGIFLHLGGSNRIPLTYVDNCADAIVLAGLKHGIDGEVFNVVDDDLPSSRQFLRLYKRNVRSFRSLYVPHLVSYLLCYAWERYSSWSLRQLPPAFNRRRWSAFWKSTCYSNSKLKTQTGWTPKVSTTEGLRRYFASCRKGLHA